MARETWVQSQVKSYQRLLKWYLMPPCLTLNIIRHGSRVKWSNPWKGVASSSTLWCNSYRKESLPVTLDYGRQLYLLYYLLYNSSNRYWALSKLYRIWSATNTPSEIVTTIHCYDIYIYIYTYVCVCVCVCVCVYSGTSVVEHNSFQNHVHLPIRSKTETMLLK